MIKDSIKSKERLEDLNNIQLNEIHKIIKRDAFIFLIIFSIFVLFIFSLSINIGA